MSSLTCRLLFWNCFISLAVWWNNRNKAQGIGCCAILIVFSAVACTFASVNVCNFIKLTDSTGTFTRSLWRGQLTFLNTCASYRNSAIFIDRRWNSARYASVLTQIFSGLGFFVSLGASKGNIKALGVASSVAFVACLFEGLTLLFLNSSACDYYVYNREGSAVTSCTMDQGAKLAIAATVLWFVAAVSLAGAGKTA